MRWVDRGHEPAGLATYRSNFTQEWVDYYARHTGDEPQAHWGRFRNELARRFHEKCGYCERRCEYIAESGGLAPTVDHFRPRSRFPRLTYRWSNWIFSCKRCNDEKVDRWPQGGLIDPCASAIARRPEHYFDYEVSTGELVPKGGLNASDRRLASRTIAALGLNKWDILIRRSEWIREIQGQLMQAPFSEWATIFDHYTSVSAEYGGIAAMFLTQYQQPGR